MRTTLGVYETKPITIAITGSAGKTTTKEMIASVLRRRWNILKTQGNRNTPNHTKGLRAILDSSAYDAAVLEYGLNGTGSIARHCGHIQPQFSVVTNIGSAHIGNYGADVRNLAAEKSEIFLKMKPDGTLFVNADDPNSKHLLLRKFRGKLVKVSTQGLGDYNASDIEYTASGMTFQVSIAGLPHSISIPVFGTHQIYNALYAIAVSDQLGFTVEEIKRGLWRLKRPKRRLYPYELANDILLIDDSYSANPHAMKAAIDVLQQLGRGKRTIAVLGTMLHLGKYSEAGHREVGAYAADKKIDYLVTFGEWAKPLITGALKNGYRRSHAVHFNDLEEMHKHLENLIQPGTVILVKASNAMNFWQTVNFIYYKYK